MQSDFYCKSWKKVLFIDVNTQSNLITYMRWNDEKIKLFIIDLFMNTFCGKAINLNDWIKKYHESFDL